MEFCKTEKLKLWLPAAEGPSQLPVPTVLLPIFAILLQHMCRLLLPEGASS